MKNRTRETCTSGSVRDEDGNVLIYSANDRGIEETSASFEARSAPRSYPTLADIRLAPTQIGFGYTTMRCIAM